MIAALCLVSIFVVTHRTLMNGIQKFQEAGSLKALGSSPGPYQFCLFIVMPLMISLPVLAAVYRECRWMPWLNRRNCRDCDSTESDLRPLLSVLGRVSYPVHPVAGGGMCYRRERDRSVLHTNRRRLQERLWHHPLGHVRGTCRLALNLSSSFITCRVLASAKRRSRADQ